MRANNPDTILTQPLFLIGAALDLIGAGMLVYATVFTPDGFSGLGVVGWGGVGVLVVGSLFQAASAIRFAERGVSAMGTSPEPPPHEPVIR